MISIGSVYKGPELKGTPLNVALMRAARVLNEVRGPLALGSQPLVNAVFVVPGSLGRPEFDGLELGQYSKKDKALVVQVAVPEKAVSETPQVFIVEGLRGANALAFEFFRQRGEVFPLRDAEQMVTVIERHLKAAEDSPA